MWKKQEKKRFFKSFICIVLAIILFVTNVPDLGLVLKVMANPNPDKLMTMKEKKDIEIKQEDTESELNELEESLEIADGTDLGQEEELKSADNEVMQSETEKEINNTVSEESNFIDENHSDYIKTVFPEDMVYDEIIDGDTVLSDGEVITNKKILYQGNVIIDSNMKFLNCTIRITGNMIIQRGYLESYKSLIWTDGDFRIQTMQSSGEFGETSAYLSGGDTIVVKGDFYTDSNNIENRTNKLLELYGDFYLTGESCFNRPEHMGGIIVFVGETDQHVSMGTGIGKLGHIKVANREGKIHADTPLWGVHLENDVIIAGEEVIVEGKSNGHMLTIEGDFVGKLFGLNQSSTLHIKGNYRIQEIEGIDQSYIIMDDNTCILVEKDLRIQEKQADGSYTATTAYLDGSWSKGARIVVKGDLYTESSNDENEIPWNATLELHGSFYHIGNSYFNKKSANGFLMFAGESGQHVSMGTMNGKLGKIKIANIEGRIYADTPLWGVSLFSDATITGNEVIVEGQGNGRKLTIEGDFLGKLFKLNLGSALHVLGDYRIEESAVLEEERFQPIYGSESARIVVENDFRIQKKLPDGTYTTTADYLSIEGYVEIAVKGDFYTDSNNRYNEISPNVILELYSDFYGVKGYFNTYPYGTEGKVVFAGEGEQKISMQSGAIHLLNVMQNESCEKLILDCAEGTVALAGDVRIKEMSRIDNLELHGYTAELHGSTNISGDLYLMNGSLNCKKDLTLTGTLRPLKGILNIEGSLYIEEEGVLTMEDDSDMVVVKGSLYNNSKSAQELKRGMLEIKGDFIQSTSSKFMTGEYAFMQISGPYHHNIQFPAWGAIIWFHNLGLDAGMDYSFSRKPIWTNLYLAMDTSGITERIAARYFGKSGTNPATGNYAQSFSDITVQSAMGPFEITHSYNSMSEEEGVLGKGFVFSQNIKMRSEPILGTDQKTIFMPDGSRCTFLKNSSGIYEAQDSRGELAEKNGIFTLKTQDQAIFAFDANGNIQFMEDKYGNRMEYTVDEFGNTSSIKDNSGTNITFQYEDRLLKSIKNEETSESAQFEFTDRKLSKCTDASGKSTGFEYNTEGLLSKIINHDGSTFEEITYIKDGKHNKKVKTVLNMAGNVDTYQYDDNFRKTTITDSNGRIVKKEFDIFYNIISSTNALGETVHTKYSQENGKNKYGEVESETDAYGNVTIYSRDAKGRVIRVTYPDGKMEFTDYDEHNNIIRSIDRNDTPTYYIYDKSKKYLLEKATPLDGNSAYNSESDKENFAVTCYTYDMEHPIKGLLLTETNPLGDENNYLEYVRNRKGQILNMTTYMDGKSYTTTYQYNNKWLPVEETDPDGVTTKYFYNKYNEIILKSIISADGKQSINERVTYDAMGNKKVEAGPLEYDVTADNLEEDTYTGPGTYYTFNEAGQVTVKTDAMGNTTTYEYDLYGNIVKETYPDNSYSEYTYDASDRKTSTSFYDSTTSTKTLLEEQSYGIYAKNLKTTRTTFLDKERTAVTTEISDYEGKPIIVWDADGNSTSKSYTGDGKVATETDADGKTTTYTYDALGNLTVIRTPFDGSSFAKTIYTYDKAGNKLTETVFNNPVGSSTDTSRKTVYEYDAWNNLIKTIQYDGKRPISYVQGYYDFRGRLLREYKGLSAPLSISGLDLVQPNGDDEYAVTKYEYNYQDKVIKTIDNAGKIESNTFDSAGNLLQAQEKDGGTFQASYDILGHKTAESKIYPGKTTIAKTFSYDNMGRLISTTENNKGVTFTYNGLGQMIKETYGDTVKEYKYDNTGSVLSVRISDKTGELRNSQNTYDLLGRLTSVSEDGVCKVTYTYDMKSRLLTTRYENGITLTNTYNYADLPISIRNEDAAGKIISEYQYTYAIDGNQLSKTDAGGTTSYKYDGLNRLTEETHANMGDVETTSYEYDENGNRTRIEKRSANGIKWEECTYDQLDQLLTKSTPDGITSYTYDRNGNLLTKSEDGKNEIQTYDAFNRLISWTDGSEKAEYTYYPDNNRATKTVNGVKTRHIWSEGEIQVDITEGKTVEYIHGHRLIESSYGTYLYNAHGDVVQLVKDNQVAERYDYDAYGNPKEEKSREKKTTDKPEDSQSNSSHTDQNPYRYTGEYRDEETGYIYLRARYYDVRLGRFLNTDPARQGTNWYAYAGGNPVLYHDPSGLSFSEAWEGIKNTGRNLVSGAQSVGRAIGSAASAAGKMVKEFTSTTVGKVVVGATVIAVAVVATVATGGATAGLAGAIASGALTGAIAGAASGAAVGGVSGVISNRISTGSWEGSGQALVDGAASGFMQGSIAGAVGGAVSGGIRYGTNALAGKLANPNSRPNSTYGQGRPTQGQGYSKNGYNPKPGERTIEGYVKNNVSPNAETKLFTKSAGFNNSKETTGGLFKMFGSNSHGGISPHVHQPKWNMNPNTGKTFGGIFKTSTGPGLIDFPNTQDIKHLYQYLVNGMYH